MLVAISGVASFFSRVTFEVFSQSAKLDFANIFMCSICITAILTASKDRSVLVDSRISSA